MRQYLRQTAADFFTPARVENLRRSSGGDRLSLLAEIGTRTGPDLFSAAVRMESETLTIRRIRENPFLGWLIEKEFQEIEEEAGQPAAEAETRTEGGLILPHWVKK